MPYIVANLIVVVVMVIGDVISQEFHKFITYKTFQLHKYLLHSYNGFILTGTGPHLVPQENRYYITGVT